MRPVQVPGAPDPLRCSGFARTMPGFEGGPDAPFRARRTVGARHS
jgi:hypothetical protein